MAENKIAYMTTGHPTYRDYMFLASMIRVRARNLVTFERLEQMLQSGSFEDAARLLAEAGWPNVAEMSPGEIDDMLAERRERVFRDIGMVVPEDELVEIFRLKYDYHNAKAIVKGEGAGVSTGALLSKAGRIPPKALMEAFVDNDFRYIPAMLGKAMAEAKSVLARTQNPQLADFVLDKAYFAEMGELAEEVYPNAEVPTPLLDPEALEPFAMRYRALLADCANLRTCVRCVRMGKDLEFLRGALIRDAGISADYMAESTFSGDGLPPLFTATPLQEAAVLGAAAMKGGTMTRFEKECDDAILRYLANLRLMYFGPELVMWYLTVEETIITDVRMILSGLRAGISPERLRERLRDTYV